MRGLLCGAVGTAILAMGCGADADGGEETCTVATDAGRIQATIDGVDWAAEATWTEAGDGVQVVSTTADGWRFTIAAQQALASVEVGDLPVVIDLSGDEGFVTAYPDSGAASFSSSEGNGNLTLTARDGEALSGCFSAELVSSDGDVLEVGDGEFVASAL